MFIFPARGRIGDMKYMDVKTASEKWGITPRRVRILCNDGRIDGAVRNGWSWVIPDDTPKPRDGRVLRRFKALDIRPGSVDVDGLREERRLITKDDYFSSSKFNLHIARTLSFLFALEGEDVSEEDALRILSGFLVYNLSLSIHLLVINFASVLREERERDGEWGEGDIKRMYSSLMRGILWTDGAYRKGKVKRGEENVEISSAVETVVNQYDSSWSMLHPLTSSLLLSGELMRIAPYKEHMIFFTYLLFAGELMRSGFVPPTMQHQSLNEAKAAYALIASKGVYTDMTNYTERMMKSTYGELEKNV